ncbi:hypothetical protein LTR91_024633 [Friedmanniomyces endolithicus]|uniref:Uncharacterized protein n=2 Tax=Dothideomycetidae TaxID=451867 RepID=A0AAN6K3H2_9PEZI|nr:hypothetical protein LTR94_021375 [Friedmanniomyces endolithicus]KAK0362075.1 hypothetical protein LTR94_020892 [Friedmanniomyces endolithicus]KAK0769627.1 hypothetical protein LTR59_016930 [Friedmanniomyces endolithicus]KAK0769989.1 hypothetical protein LTR59_016718 [Friedmanniomyces endolithicus]KAK0772974.1 hypothetical protein LTR38_016730 [Friedmanniomyces endolithicus]
MDFLPTTPTHYLALSLPLLAILLAFLLLQPTNLVKWLQKKNYQYEVTFSLYMLTPTEKFVFNSILFLTISMLSTACILYLPDHVVEVSRRGYYYFAGDAPPEHLGEVAAKASEAVRDAATGLAESVSSAAWGAASAGQEVV